MQVIAVTVKLHKTMTIYFICVPPNHIKIQTKIDHLIKEFPKPFILLGDFNCQNETWGIKKTKNIRL